MPKPSLAEIRSRALLAADWYVNSQIINHKPYWDANHGRFVYNYHLGKKVRVSGIDWTQGRGIMVLMAAYRLTRRKDYLAAAQHAVSYLRALQIDDPALPYCGAFAEEIPQSDYCYPRDGSEAAAGYLHVYHETGEPDLLRRARLFGTWMLSVSDRKTGFPPYGSYFNTGEHRHARMAFMVGNGMFYANLTRATGERKWLEKGLRPLIDSVPLFFMDKDGALVEKTFQSHHNDPADKGRNIVSNDDGLGTALIDGAVLFKSRKYREAAVRIGDWLLTQDRKGSVVCSLANRLCYLMDLWKLTGDRKYREYVLSRVGEVMALQVTGSRDPLAQGAFRGEDERPEWYSGGGKLDYVTNRHTCYAALTLFKIASREWSAGYSAFGWKKRPSRAA
jgi:hypothetical protein